ncbi:MAG: hypothetical protein ABEI11_02825 [Haloarculaceae archaeon]
MSYGPDAVHELVEDSGMSYPVTVRELEREHALANVQLDSRGNTAMLSEVLANGDFDRFESRQDLQEKVEEAIRVELADRQTGWIAKLKSTFFGR